MRAVTTCATFCRAIGARFPPTINMHSVKNRFLMRIKNMTPDLYRETGSRSPTRDVVVLGCCLVREVTSLKAFWYVARNWRRVLEKRAEIMKRRRRVTDEYLAAGSPMPRRQPAPSTPCAAVPPTKGVRRNLRR